MKKKFFSKIALVFSLFALSLTGCGNDDNTSKNNSGTNPSNTASNNSEVKKEYGIEFFGVEDVEINLYEDFDLLEGVRAVDGVDGELEVTVVDDDGFTNDFVSSYTIVYSATNSNGDTKEVERSISVAKGVNVQNGTFAYGKAYWTFDKPGGTASVSFSGGVAKITAESVGVEAWALQLYQMGIAFEANKTYELSFDAKSTTGRSVSAGFENVGNNYSMMADGYQAITLNAGEDYKRYSIYCTPSAPVSNVKAVIYVGRNLDIDLTASRAHPIDIIIDNVSVKEVNVASSENAPRFENADRAVVTTKDQFDALPAVKAFDKNNKDISNKIEVVGEVPVSVSAETRMLVSYRVEDDEGNFAYVNREVRYNIAKANAWNLINEDFDNGTQGWTQDVNQTNGSGNALYAVNDGAMEVDIKNGSSAGWHIQLFQTNVSLSAGSIYRMTLVAKASEARNVTLEISDPSNNFAVLFSEIFGLSTEYQTFVLEYQPNKNYNVKVSLLLGGQGSNVVTIDKLGNEKITIDEATQIDFRNYEAYQLVNGDFKYGYYNWNKTIDVANAANFTASDEKVQIEVLENADDWKIQLSQTGLNFEAGKTYKVELIASALVNTAIKVEISNNLGGTNVVVVKKETVNLTTELATYSVEFTPSENIGEGKVALLFGESELTTITIDQLQVGVVA